MEISKKRAYLQMAALNVDPFQQVFYRVKNQGEIKPQKLVKLLYRERNKYYKHMPNSLVAAL